MTQRKRAPQPSQPNALLEAALAYAARGWHVLPLAPREKSPLTRLVPNGYLNATTDAATIRTWWASSPEANVGVACAPSGLLVLDVDPQSGGDATLEDLVRQHGDLPSTVEAKTGGGGRHFVFDGSASERFSGALGAGLDVKHKGYIVASPSVHPDTGALYEWEGGAGPDERDLAPVPVDWTKAVVAHSGKGKGAPPPTPQDYFTAGERNNRLTSFAGHVLNAGVTGEELEAVLLLRNVERCSPPLPEDEVRRIAASARNWDRKTDSDAGGQTSRPSRLELLTLQDALIAAEEPVDWVVPDLLAAGEKVVIAGPPKSLKTWLALHLMRGVAVGEAVLGEQAWNVERTAPVLFVQEEGSKQRWAQRIAATFKGATDAPFFYTHRGGFSLLTKNNVDWVIESARRVEARLIVVDPWQRVTPGIKENDASDTGRAWDAIHRIATETGAAVVVIHHANKGGNEPNMDSIRGSSRMAGEVDLIVVVRKQERGQLEVFLDGRDLVRDDDGGNLAVEYESDHPHRMRTVGFALNIKGPKNLTRDAVSAVLEGATAPLSTSDVRAAVATHLGEARTRQAVDQELHVFEDEGKAVKTSSGKGKPTYWAWAK